MTDTFTVTLTEQPQALSASIATAGPVGPAGADGAKWFTGTGPPAPALGDPGDMYLENDGDIWQDSAGGWLATSTNIRGPVGATGSQGIQGVPGTTGTVAAAGAGTAALPSISFAGDPNTGLYNSNPDEIGLSTNGVLRWTVGTTGALIANGTGVLSPTGNVVEQRNGVTGQNLYVYNTYTDAANYERARMSGNGLFGYERAGTGVARPLQIMNTSASYVVFGSNNVNRWAVNDTAFYSWGHNLYDIGQSATVNSPRTIYAGTSVVTPVVRFGDGTTAVPSFGFSNSPTTGLYSPQVNQMNVVTGGVDRWGFHNTGAFYAVTDNVYDIGFTATTYRPRNIYAGTSVVTPLVDSGTSALNFQTNSAVRWNIQTTGHFVTGSDNTYDIGIDGAGRPRTIYVGTSLRTGAVDGGTGNILFINNATNRWVLWNDGVFMPYPDNTYDLGKVTNRVRTIYAGTSVVTPLVSAGAGANLGLTGDSVNSSATAAGGYVRFYAGGGVLRWFVEYTGHLKTGLDNTYDIGEATDLRPRNIHLGGGVGFYGTGATTKKTVTGSRAGNAALASLLTQLAGYGLVTDSSTA